MFHWVLNTPLDNLKGKLQGTKKRAEIEPDSLDSSKYLLSFFFNCRFTRVQRATCVVTLVLSWMAVNATWFGVAPEGQVDLYLGFKGYSLEEVVIGIISAVIVFPLNFLLYLLFRKSRERKVR